MFRNWSISEGYTTNKIVHSGTQLGSDREVGIHDWSGSFSCYGPKPLYMPGTVVSASFYRAPDSTGDEDNGDIYTGLIYIESVAITINFVTNEVIGHVVNFGGSGSLTVSQGSPFADATPPVNSTPCFGKVVTFVTGTPDVETVIEHVTQVTLTFTREAKTSVNSGESDSTNKCLTVREPGAAIDWTLAISTEEGSRTAVLIPGYKHKFRVYVTTVYGTTQSYELVWGLVKDITGLTVDRETANIIAQTYNVEMKGFISGVAGNITLPGEVSAWWPAA